MKPLAILCLVAGGATALAILRAFFRKSDGIFELATVAMALNLFVGILAWALFRRPNPEATAYRVGLIIAYSAGLASGVYLYFH